MKTFEDVLNDIEKSLKGIELHSISGTAAPFSVVEVDRENENVVLDVGGNRKTWTFERLKLVWDEMCYRPAANVELVFGGSGSSRNQVETIYASLAYVEWLYVNRKKCVAYIGEETHPYGKIKKMSDEKEVEYNELMKKQNPRNPLFPDVEVEIEEVSTDEYARAAGIIKEHLLDSCEDFPIGTFHDPVGLRMID